MPRTRRLIGPGLLVGTVPTSTWALVSLASTGPGRNMNAGFWIQVAANLILVLAACLTGFALARTAEVRLVRRPPQDALLWVVALLGVSGALALVFLDHEMWAGRAGLPARSIWATVMAVLAPACAAAALPRRSGVSLLAGWIGGATSIVVYESLLLSIGSAPIIVFGVTLLVLVAVAVPFARAAPNSEVGPVAQG